MHWNQTPEEVAAVKMGEESTPAPELLILPTRVAGWNKYTAASAIDDLTLFSDAQIVWVDDAAYSPHAATMALIDSEDGVSALTKIKAGAEVWVKY